MKSDPTVYDQLLSRQAQAIENAKRLLQDLHPSRLPCSDKKPSTTVHELVMELNKHIRKAQLPKR